MPKMPMPPIGRTIREARRLRGLSIAKLSKITNVSRRHIAATEAGGNVTVLMLQRLMHGLQLTEVVLDETAKVTASAVGVDPAVLLTVADDLSEAAERVLRSCAVLRAYAEGKQAVEEDDELAARAAALIRRFSAQVRQSHTADKIEDLERLVGGGEKAVGSTRKRKSTA